MTTLDILNQKLPLRWQAIADKTAKIGFDMPSETGTGSLLRLLAASKPGGRFLELGTGTGLATAYLLDGMDQEARLISVDNDAQSQSVARSFLGDDPRISFETIDGAAFLFSQPPATFDLIFADTWPGKYNHLEAALALVRPGGFYVGDDMLPQPSWSEVHQSRVDGLLETLKSLRGWHTSGLDCATGLIVAVRLSN